MRMRHEHLNLSDHQRERHIVGFVRQLRPRLAGEGDSNRQAVRMGKELVVVALAVAEAVPSPIKGQKRHDSQRPLAHVGRLQTTWLHRTVGTGHERLGGEGIKPTVGQHPVGTHHWYRHRLSGGEGGDHQRPRVHL